MTTEPENAGIFDAYNARSLSPEDVAKKFVIPRAFIALSERTHATVIGPRGSGKTSLLKMLDPRALQHWRHSASRNYREKIVFTGVFIPTDISWNRQTSAIVENLDPNLKLAFRNAAFTTHVLHQLLDIFCWRSEQGQEAADAKFRGVVLPPESERSLAQALAKTFQIEPETSTLLGVKHALASRLAEIWQLAQATCLGIGRAQELPRWIAADMLSLCSVAIELYDDAVSQPSALWALMFDELELAPEWVFQGLQTALRSTNPKLLYKLAISPFNEQYENLKTAVQAVPGQDYSEIRLWYEYKEVAIEFSRDLALAVMHEAGIEVKDPSEVLGHSLLDFPSESERAYSARSPQVRLLREALKTDPSFARYWSEAGVDLDRIADLPENVRAAKVRKIYPLVAVRNYFRTPQGSPSANQQRFRGRKSLEIYCGASGLLSMMEGNPRWTIGITKSLIMGGDGRIRVPRPQQAAVIESAMHRFRARLKTINITVDIKSRPPTSLLRFIDSVGEYFGQQLIAADFHPQPPLTFTVDSNTSADALSAIGRALNVGALIYLPDKTEAGMLNDVRGKRFRLSYLLAPGYRLPLRIGSPAPLSRVLSRSNLVNHLQSELDLEERG